MRAFRALVASVALLAPVMTPGLARADAAAEEAAREIADARERANEAADALFGAESLLDTLELEQVALEAEVDKLEQQVAKLQRTVELVAVNRFTRSGGTSLALLTGFQAAGDQAQRKLLLDVANENSADGFDQFDQLRADLDDARTELDGARRAGTAARAALEQRRREALAQIDTLKAVEAGRLEDEAVRNALAAEQAERRSQSDAALLAAAEQQRAVNTPAALAAGSAVGDGDIDDSTAGAVSRGGAGGGLTGQAGPGGRAGANPGVLGDAGWVCPVQGTVFFGDTWGAPRSGGRSHQGVDMIGERGLPVVAVVNGVAQSKINRLGGNSVWLNGADGTRFYYAHLDEWATLGPVTAGTVIGYLGDTGNAKFSVPHLHFEIHPGGGNAVNPYPTVRSFC